MLTASHTRTADKNPVHCLFLTWKTEGFLGLYRGTFSHLLRIAPHTVSLFPPLPRLEPLFRRVPAVRGEKEGGPTPPTPSVVLRGEGSPGSAAWN